MPSISASRKLPAIAEKNSVGIEHWENDELDVLAQLLGDHVLAGEELKHTFIIECAYSFKLSYKFTSSV